jgi:hypothetical protein
MNIAPWRLACKSLYQEWKLIVLGSIVAVVITIGPSLGMQPLRGWIGFFVFTGTLLWAYIRAWTKEHRRCEKYRNMLIDEYVGLIGTLRPSLSSALVVPSEAEVKYYLDHIQGDPELIREAVQKFRAANPDWYNGPLPQGVMTR